MGFFSRREEPPKLLGSSPIHNLHVPSSNPELDAPVSELPTIPSSNSNDNLNENMIKSAMDDHSVPGDEEVMDDYSDHSMDTGHVPVPPSHQQMRRPVPQAQGPNTIFVKIDEFNKAKESLEHIDGILKQLASDIKVLRDTKTKEIEELDSLDAELKKINAKLSRIDHSIFSGV